MILVKICTEVSPYKLDEFKQALKTMIDRSLKEPGLSVSLYQNFDNKCLFCYLEEWDSQEKMEVHCQSDGFRALIGAMQVLGEITEARIITAHRTIDMPL